MIKGNWLLSLALVSTGITVASIVASVNKTQAGSEFLIRPSLASWQPAHSFQELVARPAAAFQHRHRSLHLHAVAPEVDDHFVQSFAAPRPYPELSALQMALYATPPVHGDSFPLYAPGSDPRIKVKAARDANGTKLGKLFISSAGLSLALF